MPVTVDELNGPDPLDAAFQSEKITAHYLVKKLKRELNAKETKTIKVKGAVGTDNLPRGFRVVACSGTMAEGKEGQAFGDGDTVIQYDVIAWGIRQKARESGMAHYQKPGPGDPNVLRISHELNEEDRNLIREGVEAFKTLIIKTHYDGISDSK